MLGILLINKPKGMTSHDVVAITRRRFNTKRVGHAGTLDPNATGLLVLAVGPATRFLQYLDLEPKEYEGTFLFGKASNTQDVEGDQVEELPVPDDLAVRIEAQLPQFIGEIQQLPPMFSAVKKAGKPLYVYARKGEDVEREKRTIFIDNFDMLSLTPPQGQFRIICSGGTYVRTLAHDLGQAVGCGALLEDLVRTQVGIFHLDYAVDPFESTPANLIPLREALHPMPICKLNEDQVRIVRDGQPVRVGEVDGQFVGLAGPDGEVLAIGRLTGNLAQPDCVIPAEALLGPI